MPNNSVNKSKYKWIIPIIILGVVLILTAFTITICLVVKSTLNIQKNGKEFTAVCIGGAYSSNGVVNYDNYHYQKTHNYKYKFKITEPEEVEGRVISLSGGNYSEGSIIHGKYILNEEGPVWNHSFRYIVNHTDQD